MLEIEIPGRRLLQLEYLALDVNGTIAVDGRLVEGVIERLAALRQEVDIHLLTADTHGRQAQLDAQLGLRATRIAAGQQEGAQKADWVRRMGAERVCYAGNGGNDVAALEAAALGIAVLGQEGVNLTAMQTADILVPSITTALDLLLHPARLVAALRV